MVGKLFLFAFVGIAFAQGSGLEEIIKRGVLRANGINENGKRRIEATVRDVDYKSNLIQEKTDLFVMKSNLMQERLAQSLGNMARGMEEKAKATNAPQSVFECIRRVEENANNQIDTFTKKFQTDVERTKGTKLANIKTDTKPLEGMPKALQVRFERAVRLIEGCQDEACVNTAVKSFATWLEALSADMRRILGQVSTILNNFMRDTNMYFQNTNRQVSRVNGAASLNMRRCFYSKEDFTEEN